MSEGPVLQLEGVTRTYGTGPAAVRALDDVSLALHRRELVALVGPSGSGKTTLLQLAGALDRPTSGRVLHGGVELAALSAAELTQLRRREIGFVFQSFNLVPGLSAEDNVALVARLDGVPRARARDRARALLARVGLDRRRSHRPGELSGGEQQRVAIARALMNEPGLVLADEPTGNLDQASGDGIVEMLMQVAAEDDASVLIVTHDMRLLPRAERVLTMRDGRLQPEPQGAPVAS
ncbi:MAG TPA: ABC transporter ATP-binding protein [Conexibacter sp.]|nr:ABC transporter ATP-binding protein [Conexibacter sp.]